MSASAMTTQKIEEFEEIHLDDPELEEELFGEMTPAIRAEIMAFGEESESTTSSSPTASTRTSTKSRSSSVTSAASDEESEALLAEQLRSGTFVTTTSPSKLVKSSTHLSREEERRLKLERRAMALKEAEWKENKGNAAMGAKRAAEAKKTEAQKMAEEYKVIEAKKDAEEKKAAKTKKEAEVKKAAEMKQGAKVTKTAEAKKDAEVKKVIDEKKVVASQKAAATPATPTAGKDVQKRKRAEDDDGEEEWKKGELREGEVRHAVAVPPLTHAGPVTQKRKRGDDDKTGEEEAKRKRADEDVAGEETKPGLAKLEVQKALPSPPTPTARAGLQKRKREDDAGAGEKGPERELKEAQVNKEVSTLATTDTGAAAKKRKRGDDDEAGEKGAKRELMEAGAAEMKKQQQPAPVVATTQELTDAATAEMKKMAAAPVVTTTQKRKRGLDDDDGERTAMRGTTDAVATEIGKRREHAFSDEPKKADKRRDSVISISPEGVDVGTVEKVRQHDKAEEQHLATPVGMPTGKEVPVDVDGTVDDDEMTRMLKEELAKPCVEEYSDDESKPEDPRVEEILQPLTESEKLQIAKMADTNHKDGKLPITLKTLKNMVEMTFTSRAQTAKKKAVRAAAAAKKKAAVQAEHAPKEKSPLANNGVTAEEQEIDRRPRLAPKSRKSAPKAAETTTPAVKLATTAPAVSPVRERAASPPPARPAPIPAPTAPAQRQDYTELTNLQLKDLCRERGLIVGGNKKDLIMRLKAYNTEISGGAVPTGVTPGKNVKKHAYSWMTEGVNC